MAGRTTLGMAIPIPGWNTCIVPFVMEDQKGWFQDRDPFTRGGLAPRSVPSGMASYLFYGSQARWHNAIITGAKSGDNRQVLDQRGVISRYTFYGTMTGPESTTFRAHWVVFLATTDDTNEDGRLDDRDASYAILASTTGDQMHVVTPKDGQVWGVTASDVGAHFYFQVVHDTSKDGLFSDADATTIYVWKPDLGEAMAVPVVSKAELESLERLLR